MFWWQIDSTTEGISSFLCYSTVFELVLDKKNDPSP